MQDFISLTKHKDESLGRKISGITSEMKQVGHYIRNPKDLTAGLSKLVEKIENQNNARHLANEERYEKDSFKLDCNIKRIDALIEEHARRH